MKRLVWCVVLAAAVAAGGSLSMAAEKTPQGRWYLQEGSGQKVFETIKDRDAWLGAGQGADGQDPAWVGGALIFDGEDDCVSLGGNDDFHLTDGGTIALWIKPDKELTSEASLLIKRSNYYLWLLQNKTLRFGYYHKDPKQPEKNAVFKHVESDGKVPADTWTHVATTFGDGKVNFYINGKLDSSKEFLGSIINYGAPLRLGCEQKDVRPYKGAMSGVSLFNAPLDADDVAEEMNETDPRE